MHKEKEMMKRAKASTKQIKAEYLRRASRIMYGTGEENPSLAIDNQRSAVVRHFSSMNSSNYRRQQRQEKPKIQWHQPHHLLCSSDFKCLSTLASYSIYTYEATKISCIHNWKSYSKGILGK